jgi:hypothetical protein
MNDNMQPDPGDQRRAFIHELWQQFEVLQEWAIANWPDREHPLSSADFVATRSEILNLGLARRKPHQIAPEPAEGGPQYEEVTPAPWP